MGQSGEIAVNELAARLRNFELFYELAEARNTALVENLFEKIIRPIGVNNGSLRKYPFAILVNGKDVYSKYAILNSDGYDYTEMIGWPGGSLTPWSEIRDHTDKATYVDPERFKATGIIAAMMGHGYTTFTLPSDGSGDKVLGIVKLSNGDELLVHCWVWFNK